MMCSLKGVLKDVAFTFDFERMLLVNIAYPWRLATIDLLFVSKML